MTGKQIRTIFLVLLILVLFILVFLIFKPFLNIILWSTFLALIIRPIYNKLIKKIPIFSRSNFLKKVLAIVFSILVIIIIVLPLFYVVYNLTIEFKQFSIWIDNILKNSENISFEKFNNLIENIVYKITGISISFNIIDEIIKFFKDRTLAITPLITTMISKVIYSILGLFFLIITIYFMLTDGEVLVKYFKDVLPIENSYIENFAGKFYQVMNVIIKGYFIIGLYQSVVFFIILVIFKYSNPFLFSSLAFIASFIPMLGATIVWLPIAILIGISQNVMKGIIFGILAGFFVSTLDNFIRPAIISNKIKIHPLLLFFSIIGGIMAFGYNGVLLGPLFLALLYSSLEIMKTQND